MPIAQGIGFLPATVLKLTAVHIAAIFFLSGLLIATALLGAQYVFRYRKYHIARAEDQDSLADPTASSGSIQMATRASSNATLLSEVISLTRLRPHIKARNKHSRLRESMDCEQGDDEQEVTLAKEEESLSHSSTATLTQQDISTNGNLATSSRQIEETSCSLPCSPQSNLQQRSLNRSCTLSSEKDQSNEKDDPKKQPLLVSRRISNASVANLTNGYYSPAASVISTAAIRSTNAKETKEKRNREKLLAGPAGSDFSLAANDTDLELDYYDYNVVNAGAAPGSYLGMDPAFLVWIPPLDESGEILPEGEDSLVEDIRPKIYIDPGSNQESPEEEMLLPKRDNKPIAGASPRPSPILKPKNKRIHPLIIAEASSNESVKGENEPLVNNRIVSIQLHEFPRGRKKFMSEIREGMEKETKVEKSPTVEGNILDEIKFADDDEDDKDLTEIQCNIELSYHDSNLLSSS